MIQIDPVRTRADMRGFVQFPKRLYRDCPQWVPPLEGDEYDTFNPKKNRAYGFCEAQCFLARRDGKIVGRVAAIVNHRANEKWQREAVRFGWIDFVEDREVLDALLGAVTAWGRERKCTEVIGPLGFTDMDPEGMLVEGFDKLSSFTCLYNYAYYPRMLEEAGFTKDADWIQRRVSITDVHPVMYNFIPQIEQRFGLHVVRCTNMRKLVKKYGAGVFEAYNAAFMPLYSFSPLDDSQVKKYLSTYATVLNARYVAVCVNEEDKPVGFVACVPSLSRAMQQCGGRLFPFGFLRILKAARRNKTVEALIMGVDPKYQGSGAIILMIKYLHENCLAEGVEELILNPQLEDTIKALNLFDDFETSLYVRRRSYTKRIA